MAKRIASKKSAKTSGKSVKAKEAVISSAYDLVIVESPSKAKTIKKYLGRGFQVVACNGHIKDLPKSKLGVDVKNGFKMDLVPVTGKQDKLQRIKDLAKGAKSIYLAPDMDREGEAIAFHLAEEIGKKRVHRVVFNAVTKSAIKAAIDSPSQLNEAMYESQKTRRILDRLVGYKISPILWEKVQRGISAGRVQSVALRIIVEREKEIKDFVPTQWFSIQGGLQKDKVLFPCSYYGESIDQKRELLDESFVLKILKDIKGKDLLVCDVKKRERRQFPTAPFTTSKLQQEAANKLGFSTKKTMMIAQKLYEGVDLSTHGGPQGLITYMRTDSMRTAPEALDALRDYIGKAYGKDYLASQPVFYKKKGIGKVQDAHEAIRPTSLELHPDSVKKDLEPDEFKLYELIWNKFIASQMAPAVVDQTTISFECSKHFFRSNGSVVKFLGFRQVYLDSKIDKSYKNKKSVESKEEEEEDNESSYGTTLPEIFVNEKIKVKTPFDKEEHWTQAPPRYNEASLVKALEEEGIGRPSTYASIVSNITERGYVDRIENRFVPTELGTVVSNLLVASFPEVMDVAFTAKIEHLLDQIEDGEIEWKKVLKDFWRPFEVTLKKAQEEMKNLKRSSIPTGMKCRRCDKGEYHIKWGRNGQFLTCSNYPECTSTEDFKKHLDGTYEIIEKDYAEGPCQECGKRMIVKRGRYGRFIACEDYPHCKSTGPYTLDITCPECNKGKFTEKQSRYGKLFYGCSNYPDCNNAVWSRPYKQDCPKCSYPVMCFKESKKHGKQLICPKCSSYVKWEDTKYGQES